MMGNSRTNEKGKAPASANSLIEANTAGACSNTHPPYALSFLEGTAEEYAFESLLDMSLTFADSEDFHPSVVQIPETVASSRGYSTNPNSSNTVNTNFQGVSLLPDWNMSWGQQCANQGHNATCAGGIGNVGWESSFASFNRPQVNRDIAGSSSLLDPRDSAPVRTQNNTSFNQSQIGIQADLGGDFLSLRLGGSKESVSRSQVGKKEISDKPKEAASNELKMARVRKVTGQTLGQASGAGFMGFQNTNCGFSNQFFHENRMAATNNEVGFHSSLNSCPGSSEQHILHTQQNDMKHDKNIRSGDLDHFNDEKLREMISTKLKMRAQKAIAQSQTLAQSLNAGFMSFQSNTSGFSNHFSNVDRMNSTKNEVGVLGTNSHHILQMQQNDSKNIRSRDLNHSRAFIGNQHVHSETIGGNSAHVFNSQQHNISKPSAFEKPLKLEPDYTPSGQLQYMPSTTAKTPNHAHKQGQVISQNATPSQLLGVRSTMFSQRTAAPQVSLVDTGPAVIDEPYPKRLGVEFNVRDSRESNQRRSSSMATSFQTTNRGQVCPLPDKGLTRLTHHVPRPSVGRTDGASVSYPINSQEFTFAHGQSQNSLTQLAKGPKGTPSANASIVVGQSQKPNLHIRSHHKRSAVVPHPASHWVPRQKITHPTIHHSRPKPSIPVTTAQVHPSIPVVSRAQPADPVAARVRPVIPCAPIVRSRVPVTTAPVVSRIISKDPEATPKLSGYKCYLCKRDLALTSEGPVFQPAAPPPVAILPCGHSFHDQCLLNITPDDQAKDPPCIPCAIGEQ